MMTGSTRVGRAAIGLVISSARSQPCTEEVEELATAYGEEFDQLYSGAKPLELYHCKGCASCKFFRYRGRLAIHELLIASDDVKRMINRRSTGNELFHQVKAERMTTLMQDGVMKVLTGLTDFKQVKFAAIR